MLHCRFNGKLCDLKADRDDIWHQIVAFQGNIRLFQSSHQKNNFFLLLYQEEKYFY